MIQIDGQGTLSLLLPRIRLAEGKILSPACLLLLLVGLTRCSLVDTQDTVLCAIPIELKNQGFASAFCCVLVGQGTFK
jgi:hypothetical protein